MSFGLKDSEIKQILDIIAKNGNVESAVLYGSRAKGTFKPFSDIDLTLNGPALSRKDLNTLSHDLYESQLPYNFDLSIFSTLKNDALIDHIRRCGIEIYRRPSNS